MRVRSGSVCFTCFALAIAAFGKDVSQPVKPGALELGAGIGYARGTGLYDSTGHFNRFPDGFAPAAYGVPLRVKYGLGRGVDLKADWDVSSSNEDAGNKQGLGQPRLGIRYNRPMMGLFSTLTLPFATGDLDNGDLTTSLEMGAQFRRRLDHFRFTGLAGYTIALDNRDILRLSAKPEFVANEHLAAYCRTEYLTVLDGDAYWVLLNPGIRADLSHALAAEVFVPVTALGRSAPALWSVQAMVYWTVGR